MVKLKPPEIKPNCIYCKHSGVFENYMALCSVKKVKRPAGIRKCNEFETDNKKYNEKRSSNT